jgi:hypothetical protein
MKIMPINSDKWKKHVADRYQWEEIRRNAKPMWKDYSTAEKQKWEDHWDEAKNEAMGTKMLEMYTKLKVREGRCWKKYDGEWLLLSLPDIFKIERIDITNSIIHIKLLKPNGQKDVKMITRFEWVFERFAKTYYEITEDQFLLEGVN